MAYFMMKDKQCWVIDEIKTSEPYFEDIAAGPN
jgi:hypothetical protein